MDTFFSLFDPSSDGQNKQKKQRHKKTEQQEAVKKKDQPKGRRRNKKTTKNETLPEESSFLCDPDLTTDLLVKDGSYIECYMDKEYRTTDSDLAKRRNSYRKIRRKRNKISPAKDLSSNAWLDTEDQTVWNNKSDLKSKKSQEIGKNVNDLQIHDNFNDFEQKDSYKLIDKLDRIGIDNDFCKSDDFDNDFYSSDDIDDSLYDSSLDLEDSGDEEVFGSLPPEPRFGNVEYKLQLVNPSEKRFQHLVTQLKWRLRSGGGSAVYVVGVRDSGALRGLRARPLRASLRTLRAMAAALRARVDHVAVRRVAARRAVAEVCMRKLADTQQSVELRVAVMGANEAGKSTLIGVLTQGELDNGRGSARLNMFRHVHEVRSGRTSSLSHEILGFDAQGNVINYGCSELMTAERIGERSARLVSFLDLAGHHKYQRTTVHGLTGYSPHYAILVVSATAGMSRMTEEHIGLLLALELPFAIAVTKVDLAPGVMQGLLDSITDILDAAGCRKRPLLITDEQSARTCVAPPVLLLDSLGDRSPDINDNENGEMACIPVFPVSCVRGGGLNSLHAYLLALEPPSLHTRSLLEEESCEFQIDEIFHVGESAGPVVGGLLARGQLNEGDDLLIGPLESGDFVEISVKSIYRNRVPCGMVKAGQSASLGLSTYPPNIRQGMVLIAIPLGYHDKIKTTTICQHPILNGDATSKNLKDLVISKQLLLENGKNSKLKKNQRRTKDKNILQDLANVENCLVKDLGVVLKQNIYDGDRMDSPKISGNIRRTSGKVASDSAKGRALDKKIVSTSANFVNASDKIGFDSANIGRGSANVVSSSANIRMSSDKVGFDSDNVGSTSANFVKASDKFSSDSANVGMTSGKVGFDSVNIGRTSSQVDFDSANVGNTSGKVSFDSANVGKTSGKVGFDSANIGRVSGKVGFASADVGFGSDGSGEGGSSESEKENCNCQDDVFAEDPNDPRGCLFFQATVRVLRHSTAICPGFQATVHIGNIRQTAVIEGIMSWNSVLRAGESAPVLFRFVRQPEYVRAGRTLLFRAGLGTRGVGRVVQTFPCHPPPVEQ